MNNTVQPNTRQHSESNHRFEELDQFHQDCNLLASTVFTLTLALIYVV